jgi:hypothetical protein
MFSYRLDRIDERPQFHSLSMHFINKASVEVVPNVVTSFWLICAPAPHNENQHHTTKDSEWQDGLILCFRHNTDDSTRHILDPLCCVPFE